MAGHEDRSWSRANVVIAGAGVIVSIAVSLVAVALQNDTADRQRREDALSQYQAALTTYQYALSRTTVSDADWILDTPPSAATPNPDIVSVRVADAAVESVAAYRAASRHFEGAPWLQYCSEAISDHAAIATQLSGFPNDRYVEVLDSFTAPFSAGEASRELAQISEAVSRWRDEKQDSDDLCPRLAEMSVNNRGGEPPPG